MKRRTLAELDSVIEIRATRLVRLHVAGRRPIADRRKRAELARQRDRAFDRLIIAVQQRDREHERQSERLLADIARAPSRTPRGRS